MLGFDGSTFIKWQAEDDFLPRKSRNQQNLTAKTRLAPAFAFA